MGWFPGGLKKIDRDGIEGYSSILQHGVIGEGSNDYDPISSILKSVNFKGWISIEDGVEPQGGMERLAWSATFLRGKMREHGFC
jgi:sugar phosphate isomerase/epimerase